MGSTKRPLWSRGVFCISFNIEDKYEGREFAPARSAALSLISFAAVACGGGLSHTERRRSGRARVPLERPRHRFLREVLERAITGVATTTVSTSIPWQLRVICDGMRRSAPCSGVPPIASEICAPHDGSMGQFRTNALHKIAQREFAGIPLYE